MLTVDESRRLQRSWLIVGDDEAPASAMMPLTRAFRQRTTRFAATTLALTRRTASATTDTP
jgi:hypothetical protein